MIQPLQFLKWRQIPQFLQAIHNSLQIPLVAFPVLFVEALPDLIPDHHIIAGRAAHIAELVPQREQLHP